MFGNFSIMILLSIIIGITGILSSKMINQGTLDISGQQLKSIEILDEIKFQVSEVRRSELQTLISTDKASRDKYAQRTVDQFAIIDTNIKEYTKLANDDKKKNAINDFQAALINYKVASEKAIGLANQNKMNEGLDYFRNGGRTQFDNSNKVLTSLLAINDKEVNTTIKDASSTYKNATLIIIFVLIISCLVGLIISFIFSRYISSALKQLAANFKKMAAGDLTTDNIEINSQDEIAEIAQTFNEMVEKLKGIMQQILNNSQMVATSSSSLSVNAGEVSKASQQVAIAIEDVAKGANDESENINEAVRNVNELKNIIESIATGAQEQSSYMEQTSDVINQMAKAIEEVASNAQQVSQSAQETSQAAEKGGQAVSLTIEGMETIKTKVFEAASKIEALGEQSQQIGEIIQVIDDIAEQTNLLALNAAIEAARAGEHGKGFAVVADEVRKLAERSGKATKEIAELIQNIQRGTINAVEAMNDGTVEVEKGSKLAVDAGNALDGILSTVNDTFEQVQSISAAAEEISASSTEVVRAVEKVIEINEQNGTDTANMLARSEDVNNSVNNIAAVVAETAASSEEVSASVEEVTAAVDEMANMAKDMSKIADGLNEAVGQFRLVKNDQKCWDIMNCPPDRRVKCPAYNSEDDRCWLIPNTWCGGELQGDVASKQHRCMNCSSYKKIMGVE